ncbi:MAG: 3-oxoacyl-[acyl-carrier-protein] reductase [Desulfobulbaceae bacterium]|nr:MAG: 3-oxoacyl-[acyl-carrier-protein] reductase [Desulfobulbaceae bacterium]
MSQQDKIALVTGGSRGIGRTVALKLAVQGARVYVNFVSRSEAAEETVAMIEKLGGQGEIIKFDVADYSATQEAVKDLVSNDGPVDILVNNAGITRDNLIARMKEDEWDQVMDTNLKGTFNCCKAVIKQMMKKRWGRIINISSVVGFSGNSGQVNYSAAKAGMSGLTKSLAREFASRKVTVNCVAPGYIITEMTEAISDDAKQKMLSEIPMGTLGVPEDVAAAVAFLASDEANYITGQTIHVNGGMYM